MGKSLIQQRHGKGTSQFRAHSFRWKTEISYRNYDNTEKTGVIKGKVLDLIDCPGHTAPIALIKYENGDEACIPAPLNMKVNDEVSAGSQSPLLPGCILPLKNIPEGTAIYNIESIPGGGGAFCRTAGCAAKILSTIQGKILVELPSKKVKSFSPECRATIGVISGSGRLEKPWLKAGKKHHAMRALGKYYPNTSGVAMNAVNHPFGSGRGRHVGKPKTIPRFAPPGRKVGKLRARKTGRGK